MPDKPNNEMDELLQAYAKQRRDNPEVRMHPATRRMLQGEVQRTYAGAAEPDLARAGGWWRNYWPYLAVTAVLAFIVIELVLPGRAPGPEMTVAQKEEEASERGEPEVLKQVTAERQLADGVPAPPAESPTATPQPEPEAAPLVAESPAQAAPVPAPPAEAKTKPAQPIEIAGRVPPPEELETTPLISSGTSTPVAIVADARPRTFFREQAGTNVEVVLATTNEPVQLERVELSDRVLTIAPPVQTSSAIQRVPAQAAAPSTNTVLAQSSNAPQERVAATETDAQAIAQRAWEARMRALAPPADATARRREATPAGAATAPVAVATAPAQSSPPPARPAVELLTKAKSQSQLQLTSRVDELGEQSVTLAPPADAPVAELAKAETPALTPATNPTPATIRLAAAEPLQPPITRMTELTNLGAAQRTWFLQATNPADHVPPSFLPNFNVERLGDEVRFLDADGSVYQGTLTRYGGFSQFEPATGRALGEFDGFRAASRFAPVGAIPDDLVITNGIVYDFAVEGTNLTLGVPVTVRGKYVERTNAPSTKGMAGVAATSGVVAEPVQANPAVPKSRAAIVGAAVIGGTNTVMFKALAPED